jgi:hypothetical protein
MLYRCTWMFQGKKHERIIHDRVLWKMFDLEDQGVIQDFTPTAV